MRSWVVAGCAGSAAALLALALAGQIAGGVAVVLPATVALGFFNGMFAVAAIGSMMALAGEGREEREGTRMGLWGASQAIAAGAGGLFGAAAVDLARHLTDTASAFGLVFIFEAGIFAASAWMAAHIIETRSQPKLGRMVPGE